MKIIPFDKFIIKTVLSTEKVQQIFQDIVESPRYFIRWLISEHKPFQGKIENMEFIITRIIHDRNSFMPVIKGKIIKSGDGSVVKILIRPYIAIIILMLLLAIIPFLILIDIISNWILTGINSVSMISTRYISIPILIEIIFSVYLLLLIIYKVEASKTRE
jgi:hypothetical protein